MVVAADRSRLEARVLEIVTGLTAELQGALAPATIALDQSLERDLAIGSLERVELLLRLEQAFGVRLSDAAMMEAETPGDLARAVLTAGPLGAAQVPERVGALSAASAAPASAGTLIDALRWHVERSPERVHVFLGDEHGGEQAISYRALWDRAVAVSAGLRERKIGPGDSVALMLRTEEPFFAAFFGTLLAGAVPVPIYPPYRADRIEEYTRRQLAILTNAAARVLITFGEAERVAGLLRSRAGALAEVTTVADLVAAGDRPRPSHRRSSDPALIQYTSGSTGDPKGVLLTQRQPLGEHPCDRRSARDRARRRRRELAAALSRHGIDRRLARCSVFRHSHHDYVAALLPGTSGALAVGTARPSRNDLAGAQLRLRSVRQEDHRRRDPRPRPERVATGAQRLRAGQRGDDRTLQPPVRALRVPAGGHVSDVRARRGVGRADRRARRPAPATGARHRVVRAPPSRPRRDESSTPQATPWTKRSRGASSFAALR